ncbi:MAG: SDR family NAD(P)-dependent oxidoreductase [Chloroflexi bacterium]|nr:SDR family NAD(P)-dependent oxidoreductase [Chloroflexota bacterium]
MPRLENKVAIVTGASRGLGKATAIALAAEGARVVIASRSEEENPRMPGTIQQTAQEIVARGGQALAVRTDLNRIEDVEALVQRTLETYGGVDIIVHVAAAVARGRLVETPIRRWDLMWNVNTRSFMALVVGSYPSMKERGGGHVIVVTQRIGATEDTGGRGFSPIYRFAKNTAADIVTVAAAEGREDGVAFNAVWVATSRDTFGGRTARGWERERGLHASLFGDAIVELVASDPRTHTGMLTNDEEILRNAGITDFSRYQPITEAPEY